MRNDYFCTPPHLSAYYVILRVNIVCQCCPRVFLASSMSSGIDGTLDVFITNKVTQSKPIAISQEIRDRGSTFVANIYRATTLEEVKSRISHLKHYEHRHRKASHEIAAWRIMALKTGKPGLEGPNDFELVQGSKDDGESWAGGKVLKVMQKMAVIDAVVVVSRW